MSEENPSQPKLKPDSSETKHENDPAEKPEQPAHENPSQPEKAPDPK